MTALTTSTRAIPIDSCRNEIKKAATTYVRKRKSISIRKCLLEAGFDTQQAALQTNQSRVREQVRRLQNAKRGPRESLIDMEISFPVTQLGDWDDDDVSVLSDTSNLIKEQENLFPEKILPIPRGRHFPVDRLPTSIITNNASTLAQTLAAADNTLMSIIPPTVVSQHGSLRQSPDFWSVGGAAAPSVTSVQQLTERVIPGIDTAGTKMTWLNDMNTAAYINPSVTSISNLLPGGFSPFSSPTTHDADMITPQQARLVLAAHQLHCLPPCPTPCSH